MNFKMDNRKNQTILNDLVIIDGFSSSGKSLFSSIFGYLERAEHWQLDYRYEYIASLEALGKIDRDTAKGLLNLWADNHIYDLFISRNINLRPTDVSSPYLVDLEQKYLNRIKKKDGDYIIDEIDNIKPILPLHIHYIIGYSDILLKGFGDKLKSYIITLRNPIELIKVWFEGDWVNKIGTKRREFHLCIEVNNKNYPCYTKDYIEEYEAGNDMEKSIMTIYYFHKNMITMLDNVEEKYRNKVIFVPFEDFSINPDKYIDELCLKLDTSRSSNFSEIMKKLNLPRNNENNNLLGSSDFIEQYDDSISISSKYIKMIYELEDMYKDFL